MVALKDLVIGITGKLCLFINKALMQGNIHGIKNRLFPFICSE